MPKSSEELADAPVKPNSVPPERGQLKQRVELLLQKTVGVAVEERGDRKVFSPGKYARFLGKTLVDALTKPDADTIQSRSANGKYRPENSPQKGRVEALRAVLAQTLVSMRNVAFRDRVEAEVRERTRELQEKAARLEAANLKLQQISQTDGLTRLYNRGAFDRHIQKEWRRAMRSQEPLSLLLCDIDDFKKYNDTYGHLAGDDCLQKVAEAIARCCHRASDYAARYGGEEFAIVLPQTDSEGAQRIASDILAEIEKQALPHRASRVKNIVSLSIGVATFDLVTPSGDSSAIDLVSLADRALYQSKENGRDRFTAA